MANSSATSKSPSILLIGAGAVGATIAAWVAPHCEQFYVLDQPATLDVLEKQGVGAYLQHHKAGMKAVPVKVIRHLNDIPAPDYVLLCVKNYSLAGLAQSVLDAYGDKPVVVGLQNGHANQEILPKYFSRVIYGVICYNAWLDKPGVAGYQKKGPLVFGTPDNQWQNEMRALAQVFNRGVETVVTEHLADAVMSKLIINLTNSFTTLVGFPAQAASDEALFQKILSNLTYEGVKIAKAAGFHECKLGGMPGWNLITLSVLAPQWLTRPAFRKNVKKMVVSSMAQDVLQARRGDNELDTINGYLLSLADKYQVEAPYNRAIYALCRDAFADPAFKPLDVSEVWRLMNQEKRRCPSLQ